MACNNVPNQSKLNGLNPLAYMGVRPSSPPQLVVQKRDPDTTDNKYALGSFWLKIQPTYTLYILVNLNVGVATWISLTGGSAGGIQTLTGNSGGPVGPDINSNINVVGDGVAIVSVGNPLSNTLTFTIGSSIADEYHTDSGTAIPSAGILNVLGSGVISTSGAGNTITIDATTTGAVETLTSNTGGAVSPTMNNINVVGDGTSIVGVGNPGTSTITFSTGLEIADIYHTDSGDATASGAILNIFGTNGISTSATGNTVTIDGSALGALSSLTGNTGGAVFPTAENINVVGDGVAVIVAGNPGLSTLTISVTGITRRYTDVTTTPYVVLNTDDYLSVDTTVLAITIQLPNNPVVGRVWTVKDRSGMAATRNITVTTVGGAVTIDGATTFVMNTAYESIDVIYNGSSYEIW